MATELGLLSCLHIKDVYSRLYGIESSTQDLALAKNLESSWDNPKENIHFEISHNVPGNS